MGHRIILLGVLIASLAACGSVFAPDPVAIGRDRDALKQSPCACDEIRQDFTGWSRPT